jgi:hypothetical protein
MALSEEEKQKIKERLEKIGRLSEEDRPKLTKKQKDLIKEESERINSYNEANRVNNNDALDISLPLYLINKLNETGLKTTGDFGFYMDYCKNNGVLSTDDIDKLLDRIPENKSKLEEAKNNLAKTKSREYLLHNAESILENVSAIESLVKTQNYEKRYNPYTDITGSSGLTGFDTDIRALKNILNAKAFDKSFESNIERRQKEIADLKETIAQEYHKIKDLGTDPSNIEEIKSRTIKFNELTKGYHNAQNVLDKLIKQSERTSLLSFDDITRAQNLSNQIYDSLNFAKVYGFSSPEVTTLNNYFENLNKDFNSYRELIINAINLEKEVNKIENELNKLFASLCVSGGEIDLSNLNKVASAPEPIKTEKPETITVNSAENPKEEEIEEKKVIFIGFNNSIEKVDCFKSIEIGETYTIKEETKDLYAFKEVIGYYPKSSFITEKEFKNMYAPGKTVYLYVPQENVDLIDDELKLNTPYTIKSVNNDRITFNEISGTYPLMTFVIPETWNYIGYSLTGLKTNNPNFEEKLRKIYYPNQEIKKNQEESPKVGEKLLYFGLLKNRTIPYYPGLTFLEEYTIKEIINVNGNIYYRFEEINGSYAKESFITEKEHNKIYNEGMQPGKIVLYNPVNIDKADSNLRLGAEYIIKEIKGHKLILENSPKEFDIFDFYPCVWKDLVIHNLTGKQPYEVENFKPIQSSKYKSESPLLPPNEENNDVYIIYQGGAPKGFEDYYGVLTKGKKYKVVNETDSYYEIKLPDNNTLKILKKYAYPFKEKSEKNNYVIYNGEIVTNKNCKIKDYRKLKIGQPYKIIDKTDDGKYYIIEGFEDKKFPADVFTSLEKWAALSDKERQQIKNKPRPQRVVNEETKNKTFTLTSFALAIVGLIAFTASPIGMTVATISGAAIGSIAYYISKLAKNGKHNKRKEIVNALSQKLSNLFNDVKDNAEEKIKFQKSLNDIIDDDLKGELTKAGLSKNIIEGEVVETNKQAKKI